MRILIIGAGALGGYFGGRLLQARRDVTFLVRPRRAAQLEKTGLAIKSARGDVHIPAPPVVRSGDIDAPYDLIILGCKAYDLVPSMESFAAAVGPNTAILPVLNGMKHLDLLSERFGAAHVLGGLCMISATLDDDGVIHHLNEAHLLVYGELDGAPSPRIDAITAALSGAGFDARATNTIEQELWEKWVFIASLAGITSLMRGFIGDIEKAGAANMALGVLAECAAIAAERGFPPRTESLERVRPLLTTPGSLLTASMERDIERGAQIESDAIIGDLLARRAKPADERSLLDVVYAHLKTYEIRRARESASLPPR